MDQPIIEIPDLVFKKQVFESKFHPTEPIVSAGLVNGHVHVYRYNPDGNELLYHLKHHRKNYSCRSLQYSPNGAYLYTASSDYSMNVVDLQSGELIAKKDKAHNASINRLKVLNDINIVSGDDEGIVKLWDLRQQKEAKKFEENKDFISDFAVRPDVPNLLLVTSGDGTLVVLDLRKGKLEAASDELEDELLSIVVMKAGRKVVCGTQPGILTIWNWEDWGDMKERMLGHPESIDTMVALNDHYLLTGSSDGIIRCVHIQPNFISGVVGEHEGFPVERLDLTSDKQLLASCSHDNTVKFWDVRYLHAKPTTAAADDEAQAEDGSSPGPKKPAPRKTGSRKSNAAFFSDL